MIALAVPYLKAVQSGNIAAVNEALNDVLIEDEDAEGLKASIDEHTNFDHMALAHKLEKHEIQAFRRIAASLYAKQKKFAEGLKLLKHDKDYKAAMETTALSQDPAIVMDLLNFFVSQNEKECFAAALFANYQLVSPDAVLELAWRNNLQDVAMPFFIQWTKDTHNKLKELDDRTKPKSENAEATSYIANTGTTYMLANAAFNQDAAAYGMQQQQQQQFMGQMPPQGYMPPGYGYNGM